MNRNQRGEALSRREANLSHLPNWLQHLIALAVVIPIAIIAWIVGRDQPVPTWIEDYLIPALGWLGLILIAIVVGDWLRRRARRP
jgi:hypothetical protein